MLAELARFQNPDGGFGRALEPDLRTPASSAVATWHAFQIFRELGTPGEHPLVRGAVAYLLATFDSRDRVWAIVPPEVEAAPHAPWWTHATIDSSFGGSRINPTAGLAGALHDYPELVPAPFLAELTETVLTRMDAAPDPMDMNDFPCFLTLAEARHLPEAARERVRDRLRRAAPRVVAHDPADWAGYTRQPLDVAPSPESFLAATIDRTAIEANLDHWIDRQQPDGSWDTDLELGRGGRGGLGAGRAGLAGPPRHRQDPHAAGMGSPVGRVSVKSGCARTCGRA